MDKSKEKRKQQKEKEAESCRLENLKEKEWLKMKQKSINDNYDGGKTIATIPKRRRLGADDDQTIRVKLDDLELWKSFHRLTNEMIVTKNGRFVFPFMILYP